MSLDRGSSPRKLFGQVAIQKGFVTQFQVNTALDRQVNLSKEGTKHKLIGMVLLEMGALGTTELIDILKILDIPRKQVPSL